MGSSVDTPVSTLRGRFCAATVDELRNASAARRWTALVDQRRLFPHRGSIELTADHLDLGTWRRLYPADIRGVSVDYVPEFSRFAAGGTRGGFPSFGNIRKLGAPLILDLASAERLVILIDYTLWSGTNKAASWEPAIRGFLARSH